MSDPVRVDIDHVGETVNTVLGPVRADRLGVIAVHEALLSVMPGAQYAPDITIDKAEVFDILADKLRSFRDAGGGTVVDSTGMFHGRDVRLYEALSRATGVHVVASTGMGPEEMLGGYFLTPQTNPPTPWLADGFADLFTKEVVEGMVVPRVGRRAAAGIVTTAATREGMTATDESLFRAAALTARATGVPVSIRSADAVHDLDIVLSEGLHASRVLVGDLDRRDAAAAGAPARAARRGVFVGIDHVGTEGDDGYLDDSERATLVADLVRAGFADRVILSSNSIGVAKGLPARDVPYEHVITSFVPRLRDAGVSRVDVRRILEDNPRRLLTLRKDA